MPNVDEVWRPVPGWSNYEVSNCGRVRSLGCWREGISHGRRWVPGRVLKAQLASRRLIVTLCDPGKPQTTYGVAYLVLWAFVRPPEPGELALHDHDPNPENCYLWNLRWGSPSENHDDIVRHTGKHPNSRLSATDRKTAEELIRSGTSDEVVASRFNVRVQYIRYIRRRLGILHRHSTKPTCPETDGRRFNKGTGINAHNHPTDPI